MFFDLQRSWKLLFVGLFLSSITGCSTTRMSESHAVPAAVDPKIIEEPIALGPSLNARVTKVRFFEGERSKLAFTSDRRYETRFAKTMTRTVYTEINLDYPRPETNINFPITLYFRQNGRTLRIEEVQSRIRSDWTSSDHLVSAGNFDPGKWAVGNYEVDVYINAKKAATGYFEVY
jgi:hypothetical protein